MAITDNDIADISMCEVCRDELLSLHKKYATITEHDIEMAAKRRVSEIGLCGAHGNMLGPALYRMVLAGGFIAQEA